MMKLMRTIAVLLALVPAVSAQDSLPLRIPVQEVPGRSILVPRVLLVQLKKDLGDDEFLPKTVESLAEQLSVEKLLLTDARSATTTHDIPRDAEFYWLAGPAPMCGSGGCSVQLYWGSLSTASAGRLFPTTPQDDEAAFNLSPTVLSESTNGLFDVSTYPASVNHRSIDSIDPSESETLTFDGQRYGIQPKKKP